MFKSSIKCSGYTMWYRRYFDTTYNGAEIKQADVNLLAHPLGFYQDPEQIEKDLDFYGPRMSPDGPAMGFATLATIHAQLGQIEQAYDVFVKSYRDNALPPFGVMAECAGGRGVSPYFLTGAGGALQTLLFGFMGWRLQNGGLEKQSTVLPEKWQKLEADLPGATPQMAFND